MLSKSMNRTITSITNTLYFATCILLETRNHLKDARLSFEVGTHEGLPTRLQPLSQHMVLQQ